MAGLFELGVSALNANQKALSTTGHNIANADTEGYSRQEAIKVALPAQRTGAGYIGSGVTVDGVRRFYDRFLQRELNSTASGFTQYEIMAQNAKQLDNVLGDDATSLAPAMQRFFSALQDAADNPSSSATRQMLLSEANLLVGRFGQTQDRLDDQNEAINTQLATLTSELSSLAKGISAINARISGGGSTLEGQQPNDLLDSRDRMVQQIAKLTQVQTIEASDGSINVYIGNGQGLVVGSRAFEVTTAPGEDDPTRDGIVFRQGGADLSITASMVGGSIGGLLNFRDSMLDQTYNQLGQVALGLNFLINEQHRRGMDLDNDVGQDFFNAVNSTARMQGRVIGDPGNALPVDRLVEVEIDDVINVTNSDYVLEFSSSNPGQYTLTRSSDNSVVAQSTFSGVFPSEVEADGLIIRLTAGSFVPGDRFTIQPTRNEARTLAMSVNNLRDIALAQPIRTDPSEGNNGSGLISQGRVLDTSTAAFGADGRSLDPPLLIRFTSSTSFDVLDNSVPGSPVSLVPPMNNRVYVPGVDNPVFSEDENQTTVSFDGSAIGRAAVSTTSNGYPAETITVSTVDPDTGEISRQSVTTTLDDSAETTAISLNLLTGVSATASNQVTISDIRSSSPMTLTFNGVLLTGSTPETLADSINSSSSLTAQGITATTDGSRIFVRATQGSDFNFVIGGASAGDRMTFTGASGTNTTVSAIDAVPGLTFGGQIQLTLDEGVSVEGGGSLLSAIPAAVSTFRGYQVVLSGNPAPGDEFAIDYNTGGFSDNRNALAMANLQIQNLLGGGTSTLQDIYAGMVNVMATRTQESMVNKDSAEVLYDRAQAERSEKSGVNLDEEAARLIEYEQAYSAAAQLVTVARSLFDTLLSATR